MTELAGTPPHYSDSGLNLYKFASGPLSNNSYLLVCPSTNKSILIDVPAEAFAALEAAESTDVQLILITHGHADHTEGYGDIVPRLGVDVAIGALDAATLPKPPQRTIEDGEEFTAGGVRLRAVLTPGHTPGSTSFVTGQHLFSGDTLFPGGPGKSASPAALRQMIESITQRMFTLGGVTDFYPGHGGDGKLEDAKREYEVFASRSHPDDLCGDVAWLGS